MNPDFLAAMHPVIAALPHVACATAEVIVALGVAAVIAGWMLGSGGISDLQDRAEVSIQGEFDQRRADLAASVMKGEISPNTSRNASGLDPIGIPGNLIGPGGAA